MAQASARYATEVWFEAKSAMCFQSSSCGDLDGHRTRELIFTTTCVSHPGSLNVSLNKVLSNASRADLTICVGIDPTPETLSAWGLEDSADGAKKFALTILEAAESAVPLVKPQVAYFERFGAEGYTVLTDVIREAKQMGLLVLADAKRGDIGSTVDAYGEAWLGKSAPMQVDAITVTPYLGLAL